MKSGGSGRQRPKAAAHYLLEKMSLAGAKRAYFVLSKGKWDIPAYFGDGSMVNMAVAYLMTALPYGVPFTVDSAFPFLTDKQVMFGFPDIILQPDDIYLRLLDQMRTVKADLVLGSFSGGQPAENGHGRFGCRRRHLRDRHQTRPNPSPLDLDRCSLECRFYPIHA